MIMHFDHPIGNSLAKLAEDCEVKTVETNGQEVVDENNLVKIEFVFMRIDYQHGPFHVTVTNSDVYMSTYFGLDPAEEEAFINHLKLVLWDKLQAVRAFFIKERQDYYTWVAKEFEKEIAV